MAQGIHARHRGMAGTLPAAGLAVAIGLLVPGASAFAQDGEFDPMVCAGQTVNITLVAGERDELGLLDKEAEIEAATGVDLNINTEAIGDLLASNNLNLTAPESPVDIMHILGFTVTQTVGADLLEPLNSYLDDPSKTPADYDFADFPAGQLDYTGYFDVGTGHFGGDTLYLIPGIHSGSVILMYRKDLLDAAGIEVPTTWAEYLAAAEALTTDDVAGSAMVGGNDFSAFLVDWYARFITMGGQLVSGDKNDGTLEVHFDSPEGIAALQNMIDLLPYSPEAVTTYGFTEAFNAFLAGKVAMMPFWSTIGGALYGPDSPVKDTVAVAPVPADDGSPRGVRGGWGLGIPKNLPQERKDCAWHILTYITSKGFEKHQVLTHQTDPNRSSTGSDAEVSAALPYIPEAVRAIETAQILEVADLPEAFEIITAAAEQINLGLIGTKDAATAMADLQAAVTAILQREGYQAAS